jgi:hypothetical protein
MGERRDDQERKHEGRFDEGEATKEHHPEDPDERGSFDEGTGVGTHDEEHEHEGRFDEGEATKEHHPERLEEEGEFDD